MSLAQYFKKGACLKCRKLLEGWPIRSNFRHKSEYAHLYNQGQYVDKRIREYFYYIDHQGQLFLDDTKVKNFITCFKDKAFLEFFFKRLKKNSTDRYQESFPYLSLCGRERNYVRCDDRPIVYTHIIDPKNLPQEYLLAYGGVDGKLSVPFKPETLCMLPHTGRVYHAAAERFGGIGLVKSSLAIEMSSGFVFDEYGTTIKTVDGEVQLPSKFIWNEMCYQLSNELISKVVSNEI